MQALSAELAKRIEEKLGILANKRGIIPHRCDFAQTLQAFHLISATEKEELNQICLREVIFYLILATLIIVKEAKRGKIALFVLLTTCAIKAALAAAE